MPENKDCNNCKYSSNPKFSTNPDGSKQGSCEYRTSDAYNKILQSLPVWAKIKDGDKFELLEKPPLKRSYMKETPYANCQAWEFVR